MVSYVAFYFIEILYANRFNAEIKLLIVNTIISVYNLKSKAGDRGKIWKSPAPMNLKHSISTFVLVNSISINVVNKPKSWTIAFFSFGIHCRRSRWLIGLFILNLNKVVCIIEMGVNVVFVRILVPNTKGNGANGAFKLINQMFIYVKN